MKTINCPVPDCPVTLQRLEETSSWPAKAREYLAAVGSAYAPSRQFAPSEWTLSLTVHVMTCHDALDLDWAIDQMRSNQR